MSPKIKLSVIIVNHNTADLLVNLLTSIYLADGYSQDQWEIIVVDNGSVDNTKDLIKENHPHVIFRENKTNLGFGKANNQAVKISRGEYILFLNSDTVVSKDCLLLMTAYLETQETVGALTCKILLDNGRIDPACHRGFPTPWAAITYYLGLEKLFPQTAIFSQYHQWYKDLGHVHEIDSPSGAFYLVRKKVLDQIGLFDEDFFMYGEDLDLSYRIKQAGWKIVYNPQSTITHYKKQSGLKSSNGLIKSQTTKAFYQSMKIFYRKHYRKTYSKIWQNLIFLIIDAKKSIDLARINL